MVGKRDHRKKEKIDMVTFPMELMVKKISDLK